MALGDRLQCRNGDPQSVADQQQRRSLHVEGRTFLADNSIVNDEDGPANARLVELLPSGELGPALTAKGQVGGTIFRIR